MSGKTGHPPSPSRPTATVSRTPWASTIPRLNGASVVPPTTSSAPTMPSSPFVTTKASAAAVPANRPASSAPITIIGIALTIRLLLPRPSLALSREGDSRANVSFLAPLKRCSDILHLSDTRANERIPVENCRFVVRYWGVPNCEA